jgi:superfamily II DNA or RNA helicase
MNRLFSTSQKRQLFFRCNGLCEKCNQKLYAGEWDAHHVEPYSKGGVTELYNAQALCKSCHKLVHANESVMKEIELREWQKKANESFFNKINSLDGNNKFLLTACPGAGKSLWAGNIVKNMMSNTEFFKDSIDFTIIVVPSIAIKMDFANALNKNLGLKFLTKRLNNNRSLMGDRPKNYHGMILTYSALLEDNYLEFIKIWRKEHNRKIFLIYDEIHHLGINNIWGEKGYELYNNTNYCLMMTGTPFRGDKRAIQLLDYDDERLAISDYTYNVANGVSDNVTRLLNFVQLTGNFTQETGTGSSLQRIEKSIESVTNKKELVGVKRFVFSENSECMIKMINATNEKLDALDSGEKRSYKSAGLFVCDDIIQSKNLASKIKDLTGHEAVTVSHLEENAHADIQKFKDSDARYIIAVQMISEGVDIPRIRTVSWATTTESYLKFCQVVGRAVRVISKNPLEQGYVFYHKFSWMVQFTKDYEQSQCIAFEEFEPGPGGVVRESVSTPILRFSDEYTGYTIHCNGVEIDGKYVEMVKEKLNALPFPTIGLNIEECAYHLYLEDKSSLLPEIFDEEELEGEISKVNSLVATLANIKEKKGQKRDKNLYAKIHNEVARKCGYLDLNDVRLNHDISVAQKAQRCLDSMIRDEKNSKIPTLFEVD